jgi:hypothetical protein
MIHKDWPTNRRTSSAIRCARGSKEDLPSIDRPIVRSTPPGRAAEKRKHNRSEVRIDHQFCMDECVPPDRLLGRKFAAAVRSGSGYGLGSVEYWRP